MNLHYTGRQVELSDAQRRKLEVKFQKIQKILGNRHEPEVHVILSQERHLHHAEVTLNFRHHTMVVECSGTDLFTTVQEAAEKLEKQIIRNKDKWRELKRRSKPLREIEADSGRARAREEEGAAGPRIFRHDQPAAKPLTIEEAILEMEQQDRDYVFYHDADKGRPSVLFRRRDGNFQLVEA
jgi:putative sigma-54 modulation protein